MKCGHSAAHSWWDWDQLTMSKTHSCPAAGGILQVQALWSGCNGSQAGSDLGCANFESPEVSLDLHQGSWDLAVVLGSRVHS